MTTIHGVTPIPTQHAHVYAFDISARLDAKGMAEMVETLNHAFDRHNGKINLLLRFDGLEALSALKTLNFGVAKLKIRSLRHIARYAVVGAPTGTSKIVNVLNHFIPVESRSFAAKDETDAWIFVNAPKNTA